MRSFVVTAKCLQHARNLPHKLFAETILRSWLSFVEIAPNRFIYQPFITIVFSFRSMLTLSDWLYSLMKLSSIARHSQYTDLSFALFVIFMIERGTKTAAVSHTQPSFISVWIAASTLYMAHPFETQHCQ